MKMNKFFGVLMAIAALSFAFTSCNKDTDVIKLKANSITLTVGESYKVPVEKASGTITWSSANEQIAVVSAEGEITAIAEGQAVVTAKVGKASANVSVNVEAASEGGSAPDLDKPADGLLQVVIEIPEGSECRGIALKGTFGDDVWSGEDTYMGIVDGVSVGNAPVDGNIYKFTAIEGYANWYTVTVPATEAMEFKVCLIFAGDGSWQGQATGVALHECNFSTLEPVISGDGQCKSMGANGGLLYLSIGGWNKSECAEAVKYTVTVTVPACEGAEIPSIVGSFNDWNATELPMTLVEGSTYTIEVEAQPTEEFKFAGSVSGWDNEIQYYDEGDPANDVAPEWKGINNMKFNEEADENNNIVLDFSDAEKFRWKACGEEEPDVEPTE